MLSVKVQSLLKNITVANGGTSRTLGFLKLDEIISEDLRSPLDFLVCTRPPFDAIVELKVVEFLKDCTGLTSLENEA